MRYKRAPFVVRQTNGRVASAGEEGGFEVVPHYWWASAAASDSVDNKFTEFAFYEGS